MWVSHNFINLFQLPSFCVRDLQQNSIEKQELQFVALLLYSDAQYASHIRKIKRDQKKFIRLDLIN